MFTIRYPEDASDVETAIQYLFRRRQYTDLSLISRDGGMTFEVHKLIVALYSPVLAKDLFGQNPPKSLHIKYDERIALENLVNFFYNEPVIFENISEIKQTKAIADRYEVEQLSKMCKNELIHIPVSKEDVLCILETAREFENEEKENECIELISENQEEIFLKSEFLALPFRSVLDIFERIKNIKRMSDAYFLRFSIRWLDTNQKRNQKQKVDIKHKNILMEKIDLKTISLDDFLSIIEEYPDFFSNNEISHACKQIRSQCVKETVPTNTEVKKEKKEAHTNSETNFAANSEKNEAAKSTSATKNEVVRSKDELVTDVKIEKKEVRKNAEPNFEAKSKKNETVENSSVIKNVVVRNKSELNADVEIEKKELHKNVETNFEEEPKKNEVVENSSVTENEVVRSKSELNADVKIEKKVHRNAETNFETKSEKKGAVENSSVIEGEIKQSKEELLEDINFFKHELHKATVEFQSLEAKYNLKVVEYKSKNEVCEQQAKKIKELEQTIKKLRERSDVSSPMSSLSYSSLDSKQKYLSINILDSDDAVNVFELEKRARITIQDGTTIRSIQVAVSDDLKNGLIGTVAEKKKSYSESNVDISYEGIYFMLRSLKQLDETLSPVQFIEVLKAALYFQLKRVAEQCIKRITGITDYDPLFLDGLSVLSNMKDKCLGLKGLSEFKDKYKNLLLSEPLRVILHPNFTKCSTDLVILLLQQSELKVRDESQLLIVLISWLEAQKEARKLFRTILLKNIAFQNISDLDFKYIIEHYPNFFTEDEKKIILAFRAPEATPPELKYFRDNLPEWYTAKTRKHI